MILLIRCFWKYFYDQYLISSLAARFIYLKRTVKLTREFKALYRSKKVPGFLGTVWTQKYFLTLDIDKFGSMNSITSKKLFYYMYHTDIFASFKKVSQKKTLLMLKPQPTTMQVATSNRKLNLHRDLGWMAKLAWLASFLKSTSTWQITHFKAMGLVLCGQNVTIMQTYPLFHWLLGCNNNRWTSSCADLGWVAKQWKTCIDLHANLVST